MKYRSGSALYRRRNVCAATAQAKPLRPQPKSALLRSRYAKVLPGSKGQGGQDVFEGVSRPDLT